MTDKGLFDEGVADQPDLFKAKRRDIRGYFLPIFLDDHILKLHMYSSITSTNGFAFYHYVISLYAAVQFFTLSGLGDVPLIYLDDAGGAVIAILLLLNIFHTMYIIGEITYY